MRTEIDVNKLNDHFKDKLGQFDPLTVKMNSVINDELRNNKQQKTSELIEKKLKSKVIESPSGLTWEDIKDRYKIGIT